MIKLQRYCAYQDRCHKEVREKLRELGTYGMMAEEIIIELIEQDFLNEERFARSFARGKHRMNSWGRHKIKYALKQKGINERLADRALTEIGDDEYLQSLERLAQKRLHLAKGKKPFEIRANLKSYLMGRGFESHLIEEVLMGLIRD